MTRFDFIFYLDLRTRHYLFSTMKDQDFFKTLISLSSTTIFFIKSHSFNTINFVILMGWLWPVAVHQTHFHFQTARRPIDELVMAGCPSAGKEGLSQQCH